MLKQLPLHFVEYQFQHPYVKLLQVSQMQSLKMRVQCI